MTIRCRANSSNLRRIVFEFHTNGAGTGDLEYQDPPDGPWVHHLVVKDGEDVAYYRNGALEGESQVTVEQLSPDPLPFAMGGQNGGETWAGFLSEVKLFDHAVTAEEIADLAAGSSPLPGDFDGDGELGIDDINQLTAESASGANVAPFRPNERRTRQRRRSP